MAERRSLEDVFLLSGELTAVRSVSIVTPRSEGPLQIRWMVDDGTDVAEGERVLEFDAASFVLTVMGRVNGGTARGDTRLADRFANLFFRI